jgi:hypothetical protein
MIDDKANLQLPKVRTRVRFSSPAPSIFVENDIKIRPLKCPSLTATDRYYPAFSAHLVPASTCTTE